MVLGGLNLIGQITQRRGVRQFVKFGIVGASGFVVNLIIFTLLQRIVPHHAETLQYFIIYSFAFLAGGLSNYFLNRVWTFRSSGHAGKEGAQFLAVSVLALVAGLIISYLLGPSLGHGHKLWFVATLGGMVINFFVNKYWTFKDVR